MKLKGPKVSRNVVTIEFSLNDIFPTRSLTCGAGFGLRSHTKI